MFDIAPSEFLLVAFVALVVIGPKDLPKALRVVGYWVGRARGVARQFRSGFDAMVREAELEEMEKRWKAENERIMREHPAIPAPEPVAAEAQVDPGQQAVDAAPAHTLPPAPGEGDARPETTPPPVIRDAPVETAAETPEERAPMLDLPMPAKSDQPPKSDQR